MSTWFSSCFSDTPSSSRGPPFSICPHVSVFLRPAYSALTSSPATSDLTTIHSFNTKLNWKFYVTKISISRQESHAQHSAVCYQPHVYKLNSLFSIPPGRDPMIVHTSTSRTLDYVTTSSKGCYADMNWLRILRLSRWAQCSHKGSCEGVAEETVLEWLKVGKTWLAIAGFEEEMEPWSKECKQPPEARRGKKGSPLDCLEGM